LRAPDDPELDERGAQPSHVFPLRGALQLPYGVVQRVRSVLQLCCDARMLSLTFSSPELILNFTESVLTAILSVDLRFQRRNTQKPVRIEFLLR
jgi:hypothetical protein